MSIGFSKNNKMYAVIQVYLKIIYLIMMIAIASFIFEVIFCLFNSCFSEFCSTSGFFTGGMLNKTSDLIFMLRNRVWLTSNNELRIETS